MLGTWVVEFIEGVEDGEEGLVEGARVPFATDGVDVGGCLKILTPLEACILLGACVVEYIEGAGDCPNSDEELLTLGILGVI
jgi:hypothetical protein